MPPRLLVVSRFLLRRAELAREILQKPIFEFSARTGRAFLRLAMDFARPSIVWTGSKMDDSFVLALEGILRSHSFSPSDVTPVAAGEGMGEDENDDSSGAVRIEKMSLFGDGAARRQLGCAEIDSIPHGLDPTKHTHVLNR